MKIVAKNERYYSINKCPIKQNKAHFSNAIKHFNSFFAFYMLAFLFVACLENAYNCHYFFFDFARLSSSSYSEQHLFACITKKTKKSKILEDILIFRRM